MNTWELKKVVDFKELTNHEQNEITEALTLVNVNEFPFVSIQLQEFQNYVTLYGIYFMSEEELHNYNNSGGLWEYLPIAYYKQLLGVK